MKQNIYKYAMTAMCVTALAFSAGAFVKANAASATNATAATPGQPVDLTYAAEKALPAVVHIKFVQNSKVQTVDVESNPFDFFGDPFGFFGNPGNGGTQKRQIQTPKKEATGSGVIISADGYIVTNNHVVNGADELTVTLNDNREFSARIIGTDPTTDLALIKIDGKNLPTLPIGDSDNLKVGEWVIAVGNPYNLSSTVTAGIVSAKARGLSGGGNGPSISSFIQTDAAINPGNSGGALVNTRGELVGINVQRVMLGIQGGDVLNFINDKKDKGQEVDLGTNDGVYVAKVDDDGNGAEAGLKEGDVITKFDGKKVSKMSELQEALTSKRPGDKATITYLRNKKTITKTITLKNAQGNTSVVKAADLDVLGGNFREITAEQKESLKISYGVQVIKVNNGALKDAGISRGFIIQKVNDEPVKNIEQLQKFVKTASTSKDPVLYIQGVWPTGKKAYFAVPLQND